MGYWGVAFALGLHGRAKKKDEAEGALEKNCNVSSSFPWARAAWAVSVARSLCAMRTLKGVFTKARYRRFLFSSKNPNRIFALTLFRIWAAYELGVMRYGVYAADKV